MSRTATTSAETATRAPSGTRKAPASKTQAEVWMVEGESATAVPDELATEEPLEIRLVTAAGTRNVAVTMRTPGADEELAAGFLFAEGVLRGRDDFRGAAHAPERPGLRGTNVLLVSLAEGLEPDLAPLERHFTISSACGLCGKASLEALSLRRRPALPAGPRLSPRQLYALPARLREAQGIFHATGGLHAAALFSAAGELVALREDVGRHNALDKLLGWALLDGRVPLHDHAVVLSGRASYELVQKAYAAEVAFVCAVSAPSSLAVAMARELGMTLVGFLRGERLNVYAGAERVLGG